MELRGYQKTAIEMIWREMFLSESVLCVLPTASGKTVIFSSLIKRCIEAKEDVRICVLFNKVVLINQTEDKLNNFNVEIGKYCGSIGEKDNSKNVTLATIQSIKNIEDFYNIVIVDEVHRLNDEDGQYKMFLDKLREKNEKLKIIGFTATPFRETGFIYGKNKLFKKVCYELPLSYMIKNKYTVPPIVQSSNEKFDVSELRTRMGEYVIEDVKNLTLNEAKSRAQVLDTLNRAIGRKKILWFCSCIEHAESINSILYSYGEDSTIIHSKQTKQEQDENKRKFEETNCRHLTFVTIASEGYDFDQIDCISMLRPTKSPTLMIQVIGRGLRLSEGKENCLVLDYGSIIENCGPIDAPYIKTKYKSNKKYDLQPRLCNKCLTYNEPREHTCSYCGESLIKEIEYNKKLDIEANTNIDILKSDEKKHLEIIVSNVYFDKHLSKNGNLCFRIDYQYGQWPYPLYLSEFFSMSHDFAYKKMIKRLNELGVDYSNLDSNLDNVKDFIAKKIPSKIIYEKDEQYKKIKKLLFEGDL